MKSSPEVSNIGQESLFLITKSTELFVGELSRLMRANASDSANLTYNDLSQIVDDQETLQFLQDIIPKKIKVRDYYALLGKTKSLQQLAEEEERKEENTL
ncbi:Chromatin accessibility complex protein 1 [Lamellibrachia satsuma]|nr:Chromatin accessibility complex protein 1 [Lamellibrachia satsuma]